MRWPVPVIEAAQAAAGQVGLAGISAPLVAGHLQPQHMLRLKASRACPLGWLACLFCWCKNACSRDASFGGGDHPTL